MKKRFKLIGLVIVIVLFTGCSKRVIETIARPSLAPNSIKADDNMAMEEQILIISEDYEANFNLFDSSKLSNPLGILCRKNDILIADGKLNTIFVYNYNGEIIKEIGKTGNGHLEFINPTGITSYNDYIYVLDSLNYRIQILDENLDFYSSIQLEELSQDPDKESFWYSDIMVRNENEIYVTTNERMKNFAKIYKISNQKEQSVWQEEFNGYGTIYEDMIYFALSYEFYAEGYKSGRSYFLSQNKNSEVNKYDVPYQFAPMDIVATDTELFVINSLYMSLERYTLDGQYIETMFIFSETLNNTFYFPKYLDMDEKGNIYITENDNVTIIKVNKK